MDERYRWTVNRRWGQQPSRTQATVELLRGGDGWSVRVDARFHSNSAPAGPPGQLDGLWNFEVVELFVASGSPREGSAPSYSEIEVGPHGHHLILLFDGIRTRRGVLEPLHTTYSLSNRRWQAELLLPAGALPSAPWRASACAIFEENSERQYWTASALPGDVPNFHQPKHFAPLP